MAGSRRSRWRQSSGFFSVFSLRYEGKERQEHEAHSSRGVAERDQQTRITTQWPQRITDTREGMGGGRIQSWHKQKLFSYFNSKCHTLFFYDFIMY